MFPDEHLHLAADLIDLCRQRGIKIATAESCTGGMIAGCLTAVSGSSDVFERGFNTYSNEAKSEMLGVPEDIIENHGAVSSEVALAMAEGALDNSPVALTVAVTGIAGPGGGTPDKPVGTVQLAAAFADHQTLTRHEVFPGERNDVRLATIKSALELMLHHFEN